LTKETVEEGGIVNYIKDTLATIQTDLYAKALNFRDTHITEVESFDEFKEVLESKGGFISAHWDGTPETEEKIKDLTKATIRCLPLDAVDEDGACVFTGQKSKRRVLFAKAY
jgi:prolyl-tRNA synthetase